MTTIFWQDNRLYTDSSMVKGDTTFHSLTKVKKIEKPFRIRHRKRKINDLILGWVNSGSQESASRVVLWLSADTGCLHLKRKGLTSLESLLAVLGAANGLELTNEDNYFELILIGAKSNYSISTLSEGLDDFKVYPHDKKWMLGSGGAFIVEGIKQFRQYDPIRLMHYACVKDSGSGGLIDIWELDLNKKRPVFDRIGICKDPTGTSLKRVTLDINKPYLIDYPLAK